jgi:predicted Zn finger-like uncharacterized protein
MSSAQTALIVIVCPHCGTRYQVPPETIGKGRQVSCAHCGRTWKAEAPKPRRDAAKPAMKPAPKPVLKEVPKPKPKPIVDTDTLFDETAEAALDNAFAEAELASKPGADKTAPPSKPQAKGHEGGLGDAIKQLLPMTDLPAEAMRSIAQIKAALAPKLEQAKKAHGSPEADATLANDPAAQTARGKVRQRQMQLTRNLPGSRMRRLARVAAISALALSLAAGLLLRTDLVRALPDLAGLYEMIGLKVNIVGLDFSNVETTRTRHSGGDTLEVSAKIRPVEPYAVAVPQVVISLYDHDGKQVYQWGVTPKVATLSSGDTLDFTADLPNPPEDAVRAMLSFADSPAQRPADEATQGAADEGHSPDAAASADHSTHTDVAPAEHGAPSEGPAVDAPAHQTEESAHHG